MNIEIYHNPRCSKSRQTLQLLEERGFEPSITEYLKTPPNRDELEKILHAGYGTTRTDAQERG